ncbi:MAG: T9SS type A sorting domain-containing protein, partial [Bacteroidales bacterium]
DDIWIGERARNLLLEHFENASNQINNTAKALVDTIAMRNIKDVINIQYHTNFPGTDPYYNDNPGDVSARVLYYGLTRTPYSFVDGGYDKTNNYAGLYDYSLSTIDSLDIIRRSLTSPLFNITVNSNVYNGILTVNGKITALGSVSAENMTLYIAVIEKKNTDHTGYGGVSVFYNVLRKLIPDAGGINIKKTWTSGEELTIPEQSWVIQNIKSSSDIEIIAFIQNSITKEVYQASSQLKPKIATGVEKIAGGTGNSFSLYPNPAVNKLTIDFSEPLAGDSEIKIYNLEGLLIFEYKAGIGISQYTIGNLKLKNGLYLVRILRGGTDLGFKKLMIMGN